jgi:hypothetical protein
MLRGKRKGGNLLGLRVECPKVYNTTYILIIIPLL